MTPRLERPGVDANFGNHEERIRALERASSGLPMEATYIVGVSGYSLPNAGGQVGIDMQGGIDSLDAPALTDSPDVFAITEMTGGILAGLHGLEIKVPGLYGMFIQARNGTETDDPATYNQSLALQSEGGSWFTESEMNFGGDFSRSSYGRQDIFMMIGLADGGTIVGFILESLRGGGGNTDGQLYVAVFRMMSSSFDGIVLG